MFSSIGEVFDIVLDTSSVFSSIVTVAEGVSDVVSDALFVVLSSVVAVVIGAPKVLDVEPGTVESSVILFVVLLPVVTVASGVAEKPDVEPGTVVVVDPVESSVVLFVVLLSVVTVASGVLEVSDIETCTVVFDGEDGFSVTDVAEDVVVDVTAMDWLLSADVDVSASVFIEDDADVPSKVVVILFVAVDVTTVKLVFVTGVSVDMVCAIVVVCVAASVAFELTFEFNSLVVAPVELASVVVVFPATIEVVGGSLVLAVEVTFSVVELSFVLSSVLLIFVDAEVVVGTGEGEVREAVVGDAEYCTFQIIKTINICVDRICVTKT